jgi:hypothetical protein
MEIHKPKSFHSWGEFLYEILIIVIGVLIALGLEQFVDALHWRYKVAQAEQNMRIEITRDRTNAAQYAILASCADAYLDRMQSDLLRHDAADLTRLYKLGEPFVSEAWTATAWDAAREKGIGDDSDIKLWPRWSPFRFYCSLQGTWTTNGLTNRCSQRRRKDFAGARGVCVRN